MFYEEKMVKPKNFKYDKEDLGSNEWKEIIRRGFEKGVRKSTRKTYRGRLKRFLKFIAKTSLPYEKESLFRFIAVLWRQGASGGTIEGHRSAIVFGQRAAGKEPFAGDEDVRRVTKALKHSSARTRPQRGAITGAQLEQLCSLDTKYAYGFRAAYYGVLRLKQLKKLRSGDFEGGEEPTLVIRRDKRFRQGREKYEKLGRKEVLFGELEHVLRPMEEIFVTGSRMFTWLCPDRARELVKKAARLFKWPKLNYDGMHCCRHGGAREAKLRVLFAAERTAKGTAMAGSTFAGYSKANAVRSRGII